MPALLDVRALTLSFISDAGIVHALDNIDLSIQPGEIVGLVGESGCGKSSLARAILGTLPEASARIESGYIQIDGVDILRAERNAQALQRRTIAFIPQDPFASFNPLFKVGTQVSDLIKSRKWQRNASHAVNTSDLDINDVYAVLKAVQLPDPEAILGRYPHQLSGGQRQRLMIAMALLYRPRLIIADEPTSALDVTIQAQILGLLRRLSAERGTALLFITHDLGAAWEICDRVVVMYGGQTIESSPRGTFFARPRHPYTRLLLGSILEPGRDPAPIPGSLPDLTAPPSGCRFHPRCPRRSQICQDIRPPAIQAEAGYVVSCHHPDSVDR
jgi:peptide/nickel transport system ATP-binding protein